jgi:hypothetical protein
LNTHSFPHNHYVYHQMNEPKLYLLLLGCRPEGRHTEQHDIFVGIGESLKSLIPAMKRSWPEARGQLHIDAWQQVRYANGYEVTIQERYTAENVVADGQVKLFFINLGGYKPGDFEEYHYKMIVAAKDKTAAIKLAKETAFYKHTGYKGAESHIDDKYGVDVDDAFAIADILAPEFKDRYRIVLSAMEEAKENEVHIGYFRLDAI